MTVEFFLPTLPPSKNELRKKTRRGIARTDRYESWLEEFGWEMKRQKVGKVAGPYSLRIQAKRPANRKRDLANILEALSDALHIYNVTDDDKFAEHISMRWLTNCDGLIVRVEPAGLE